MKYLSGQALIEILVAFVLLIFLLSGLVVAGLYAIRNSQYARNRSQATQLASQQLERVRVVRDTQGIAALPSCTNPCFLDNNLNFGPTKATNNFVESMNIVTPMPAECPLPTQAPANSKTYKAIADEVWDFNLNVTPKLVEISACYSDWQ